MKTSLVITTINKLNKNIINYDQKSFKNNWDFIVIGDRKSPKNFKLKHGKFYKIDDQKNLKFKFAKICPQDCYARKNIGYLLAIQNKSDVIVETDDDNYPKKNFFKSKYLEHQVVEILNKGWINIYKIFLHKKSKIWPRGLPLRFLNEKIRLAKKIKSKFYIQQGVCDGNPDVDAIYRLINKKINIKFKSNFSVSLGKSLSPFNSQNTIWFKKVFPLLYLPVTCTMRSTDIIRSLVALQIIKNMNKKILFFSPTVFQKRNEHDLLKDFEGEIPIYLNSEKILKILSKLKMKRSESDIFYNLIKSYKALIKNKVIKKTELKYLLSWVSDCKKLENIS